MSTYRYIPHQTELYGLSQDHFPSVHQMIYNLTHLTLEQGSFQRFSQFSLNLASRVYQALQLCPTDLTETLFQEAKQCGSAQHVLMGVNVADQLSDLLYFGITESQLADLVRDLLSVMSRSYANLHTFLTLINEEVLYAFKLKLNPRRLLEVEEEIGGVFYLASLCRPIQPIVHQLPKIKI